MTSIILIIKFNWNFHYCVGQVGFAKENIFTCVIFKKKYDGNFRTKQLGKTLMKISKLRNDFLKDINNASQKTMQPMCKPLAKSKKTVFLECRFKTYNW